MTFTNLLRTKSIHGELFSRLSRLNGSTFGRSDPENWHEGGSHPAFEVIRSRSPRVEFFNPASHSHPARFTKSFRSPRGAIKPDKWEIDRAANVHWYIMVHWYKWIHSQMSGRPRPCSLAVAAVAIASRSHPRRTGPLFRRRTFTLTHRSEKRS